MQSKMYKYMRDEREKRGHFGRKLLGSKLRGLFVGSSRNVTKCKNDSEGDENQTLPDSLSEGSPSPTKDSTFRDVKDLADMHPTNLGQRFEDCNSISHREDEQSKGFVQWDVAAIPDSQQLFNEATPSLNVSKVRFQDEISVEKQCLKTKPRKTVLKSALKPTTSDSILTDQLQGLGSSCIVPGAGTPCENPMEFVAFGDNFVEVVERTKLEWNQMIKQLSMGVKSSDDFGTKEGVKGVLSNPPGGSNSTTERPEWIRMISQLTAGTAEAKASADRSEDCDTYEASQSKEGETELDQDPSEEFFYASKPLWGLMGSVSQGITGMIEEAKRSCSNDMFCIFDCSTPADIPQELESLSGSPLNFSWFSFDDNDSSISKLTNPRDLSTSLNLNNTPNGLNLSQDLTAIPKDDDHTGQFSF